MAERNKIGLLFSYSEGWMGGTYYFINLVQSFLQLPDSARPHVVVLSDSENSFNKIAETGYPHLSYLPCNFKYNLAERIINKVSRAVLKKNLIVKGYNKKELPLLFGYYEQLFHYKCERKLFWIPDLQDCYYPDFLGKDIALTRKKCHTALAYSDAEVVFSSESSWDDFDKFYPASTCKKYVIPFAVTLPELGGVSFEEVTAKYNIKNNYFFAPNQFWSHKNHIVIIKAVELAKQRGRHIQVLFTGNEATNGGVYAAELKEYVTKAGLNDNIRFLGFIDRVDQLVLMKGAQAVIQPSLFEGWSTVVEDAKALDKFIFASELAVHHEQLTTNVVFFDPLQPAQLADVLASFQGSNTSRGDYKANILAYAKRFTEMIGLKTK